MGTTWTVETGGKQHVIEFNEPEPLNIDEETKEVTPAQDGNLVVDGKQMQTWKDTSEVPKEIKFEIEGKPAVLRKKGFFSSRLELFFEGKSFKSA